MAYKTKNSVKGERKRGLQAVKEMEAAPGYDPQATLALAQANLDAFGKLDDLDEDPEYGVPGQDLWDHKIALNIQSLDEMFAEVVSENTIVCKSAQVLDSNGDPVKPLSEISYSDGLPSLLRFTMPANSTSFTLRLPNGNTVTQGITSAL